MALRPAGRKSVRPVRGGVPILNKAKVRALRAFFSWMQALERNPGAKLSDYARGAKLHESTIWRIIRGDPSLAARYLDQIGGAATAGLMMAFQRGLQALSTGGTFRQTDDGLTVVDENSVDLIAEQRKWAELFAKYVHGGFKPPTEKGSVNINIGLPQHVRANLGIDNEEVVKKIDAIIIEKGGGLVDV